MAFFSPLFSFYFNLSLSGFPLSCSVLFIKIKTSFLWFMKSYIKHIKYFLEYLKISNPFHSSSIAFLLSSYKICHFKHVRKCLLSELILSQYDGTAGKFYKTDTITNDTAWCFYAAFSFPSFNWFSIVNFSFILNCVECLFLGNI